MSIHDASGNFVFADDLAQTPITRERALAIEERTDTEAIRAESMVLRGREWPGLPG